MPPVPHNRWAGLLLVAGSLLYTFAFFMAMPLLGLSLAKEFELSPGQIGAIIAVCPLISALLGFWMGGLADRLGARRLCVAGSAGFAAAFALYAVGGQPWQFFAIGALLGVSKACWEPSFKALLASVTQDETRGEIFRWRYLVFCVGAVAGPAAGAYFVQHGRAILFGIAAGAIAIHTAWLFVLLFRFLPAGSNGPPPDRRSASLAVIARDLRLLHVVLAGILIFTVFSLFDTILPLTLRPLTSEPENQVVRLMILSAVVSIAAQVPLAKWASRVNTACLVAIGCLLFALSFLVFAAGAQALSLYFAATVLFALAEAVVYPNLDILTEKIAPPGLKATYFGAADLRYFGFVAGPAAGGWVFGHLGHVALFASSACLSLLATGAVCALNRSTKATSTVATQERLA